MRRNILSRKCEHKRLVQHFKGPIKPVYGCKDCGKILLELPKEKDEK